MCRAAWPAFPDKKGGLQSRPPADSLTGKRQCPSGDGDRQADDRAAGRRDAGRGGDHHGAGRVRHGCRGAGRDGHRGDDSPGAGRRGEDRDGGNPDEDRGDHRDGDSRDGGQDGRRGDGTRGEVREGAPFYSVPWDGACPCTSLHGGRCRCGPPGSRAIRPCGPHDPRPRASRQRHAARPVLHPQKRTWPYRPRPGPAATDESSLRSWQNSLRVGDCPLRADLPHISRIAFPTERSKAKYFYR